MRWFMIPIGVALIALAGYLAYLHRPVEREVTTTSWVERTATGSETVTFQYDGKTGEIVFPTRGTWIPAYETVIRQPSSVEKLRFWVYVVSALLMATSIVGVQVAWIRCHLQAKPPPKHLEIWQTGMYTFLGGLLMGAFMGPPPDGNQWTERPAIRESDQAGPTRAPPRRRSVDPDPVIPVPRPIQ